MALGNGHGVHKGGRGRCQQQAGPRASCPALLPPPAPRDCCSFTLAALLSQQPRPQALQESYSEPRPCLTVPARREPRSDGHGLTQRRGRVSHQQGGVLGPQGWALLCPPLLGPQTLQTPPPSSHLLHPTRVCPWSPYPGADPPVGPFGVRWDTRVAAVTLCSVATSQGSLSVWHRGRDPSPAPEGSPPLGAPSRATNELSN